MRKDLIVRLSPNDHTKFKVLCASLGESMNEVMTKLILEYIDKHKAKVA